jgi:hypothetical protein
VSSVDAPRCFYWQAPHPWAIASRESQAHFFGEVSERGLALQTRSPARPPLPGVLNPSLLALLQLGYRSGLNRRVSYPTRVILKPPSSHQERNPRKRPENALTPSGKNSATRYTLLPGYRLRQGGARPWLP